MNALSTTLFILAFISVWFFPVGTILAFFLFLMGKSAGEKNLENEIARDQYKEELMKELTNQPLSKDLIKKSKKYFRPDAFGEWQHADHRSWLRSNIERVEKKYEKGEGLNTFTYSGQIDFFKKPELYRFICIYLQHDPIPELEDDFYDYAEEAENNENKKYQDLVNKKIEFKNTLYKIEDKVLKMEKEGINRKAIIAEIISDNVDISIRKIRGEWHIRGEVKKETIEHYFDSKA